METQHSRQKGVHTMRCEATAAGEEAFRGKRAWLV